MVNFGEIRMCVNSRDRPKVIFKLRLKPKGGRKYANADFGRNRNKAES